MLEIEGALSSVQPSLQVVEAGPPVVIEGDFILTGPEGPFDTFSVKICVDERYPVVEPKVFETGNRIPCEIDRHINKNGDCCITVWEHWLATAEDTSFRSFLEHPVQEFFQNQFWFESTGNWRFGERPHFAQGMLEAYAEVLGVKARQETVFRYLRALSKAWPKGHWKCPCGSDEILRHCHRDHLWGLHEKITPKLARKMRERLTEEVSKKSHPKAKG